MNDYVSRRELPPVDRVPSRPAAPVQAVQPVSANGPLDISDRNAGQNREQPDQVRLDDDLASIAEYVEVHARIADILAGLERGGGSVDDAAAAIQQMIPRPIILVPLPPASKEAVEHAAVVARRVVERASYAHAAQAHVARGTVEQVAASAA